MKKLEVVFYGGVRTIGGNKVYMEDTVDDKVTRVMAELGKDYKQFDKHWGFSEPRKAHGVTDHIITGLIPFVPGLIRQDLLKRSGYVDKGKPLDAILLSHVHFDHSEYISLAREDIPIVCTPKTWTGMQAIEQTGTRSFNDLTTIDNAYMSASEKKNSGIARKARPTILLDKGEHAKIGSMDVEAIPVDHSVPGCAAFLIETSVGKVLYTGDIRDHGAHPELWDQLIRRARREKIDIMMVEGTNITEEDGTSEADVAQKLAENAAQTPREQLVIGIYPTKDLSRVESMYAAAKSVKRTFAISPKIAHTLLLHYLKNEHDVSSVSKTPDKPIDTKRFLNDLGRIEPCDAQAQKELDEIVDTFLQKDIEVYFPLRSKTDLRDPDAALSGYKQRERLFIVRETEEGMVRRGNVAHVDTISENQGKYLLTLEEHQFGDLNVIRPNGGSVLFSKTEPFNDDMERGHDRLKENAEAHGLEIHYQHCSGHSYQPKIVELVQDINPAVVMPMHTQEPHAFVNLLRQGKKAYKGKVVLMGENMVEEANKHDLTGKLTGKIETYTFTRNEAGELEYERTFEKVRGRLFKK